jgi:AcrR family transcriptional regulator
MASSPGQQEAFPAGESTKSRLTATAAELFRTKGFAATTTRELAAALGIQKATLYHHIRRKEDLLYKLCVDSLTRMDEVAELTESEYTDPLERLSNFISSHVITALEDRDQHAVMLTELRALPPDERAEVLIMRRRYEDRVDRLILAAQRAGRIRADASPSDLRLALLNMLNWTIFWFRPEGNHTPEELGKLYSEIFLNGVVI